MKKLLSGLLAGTLLASCFLFSGCGPSADDFVQPEFSSPNLVAGATVTFESLKKGERAGGADILADDGKNWTPSYPDRKPAEGYTDGCNSYIEIKLKEVSTFNTAVVKEIGNEVQYFRLMALVDGEWVTVYQSEKIQSLRLMSFDPVTTDTVRLSIDKFRGGGAKINCIELYNEPKRSADDFNVTVYQRLDGDVPSEILAKGEEYVDMYAQYYDVYDTVLIFGAVNWVDGKMSFGFDDGEEGFARELAALKEIIDHRSDKDHEVRIICTALADGAGGNGHTGVNEFMAEHWEYVADQMVEFMKKYDLDGLDVDWEYPQTKADWQCYDRFIERLDNGMTAYKEDSILSAALSSGALGMSEATLQRFDQIQYMAYDGKDEDGYQSSLQQAQEGLLGFLDKGVDLKQINIGIAAYGRPVDGAPYWANWRDVEGPDIYWNSMQYNVVCDGQLADFTFCSPALAGDKTAYALFTGTGGVMVFRLACDKTMDDPDAVAWGIKNVLDRYTE